MVEEVYKSMVENLTKARINLEQAKELVAFAREADIPIAVTDLQITELEGRIKKMESALANRGYVIPVA